jgi:glutathione S-transferase
VRVTRENGVVVSPPDYASINPHGRVPAYVDGDLVLYESAAILLHAADRNPGSALVPAAAGQRALFYRWLVHLTNTVQPTFIASFAPQRFIGEDAALQEALRAGAREQLGPMFDWLDAELEGRDYLLGDTFCGADLFLHMLTRWGRVLEPKSWERPNVGAHFRRLSERPSVARMLEREGIEAFP